MKRDGTGTVKESAAPALRPPSRHSQSTDEARAGQTHGPRPQLASRSDPVMPHVILWVVVLALPAVTLALMIGLGILGLLVQIFSA